MKSTQSSPRCTGRRYRPPGTHKARNEVRRETEELITKKTLERLQKNRCIHIGSVTNQLLHAAQQVLTDRDDLDDDHHVNTRADRWTLGFLRRIAPDCRRYKAPKPNKISDEEVRLHKKQTSAKLMFAGNKAMRDPNYTETIFVNFDESYIRFALDAHRDTYYALPDFKGELPHTKGQSFDKRGFSALMYHSTSDAYNQEVLKGMTMLCGPKLSKAQKWTKDKEPLEKTLNAVKAFTPDFPGVRPTVYANATSGKGAIKE